MKWELRKFNIFKNIDEETYERIIDSIEEIKIEAGSEIVKEGDIGNCMYVIKSGLLTCTKLFLGNTKPTFLKEYEPGEGFGELSLLYDIKRAASIATKFDSVIWKIERFSFNSILKD
jgi:cAMP-dependent protein kinase regulator